MSTENMAWRKEASAETEGILVGVRSVYVAARSEPEEGHYFFAYCVIIENRGSVPVRLLRRRWRILDADSNLETVDGPGVVGETPRIEPGESFQYTSFCPLPTPIGTMEGTYDMELDDGAELEVRVPEFVLAVPTAVQ